MPKKIDNKWVFTDEEIAQQIESGKAQYENYIKDKPTGTSYHFDPQSRIISIRMNDGSRIDFSAQKIRELQQATSEQIEQGYITAAGDAIHWDHLQAHYTIAGLAAEIFGTRQWMRELGRKGGRTVSQAKAIASRKNGLRGGRPRRDVTESSQDQTRIFGATEDITATQIKIFSWRYPSKLEREGPIDMLLGASTTNNLSICPA